MQSIILASKSPRRQELIRTITDDVEVRVSDVEEILPEAISPEDAPDRVVVGADTVVILDGQVLGKPKDREDAVRMLRALSGKTHTVVTGCSIICGEREVSFGDSTRVEFYPLSDREIDEYIVTGEPFDKAGAYGIQGRGSLFVKGIEGDFFNVMGLPVARLNRELKAFLGTDD